MQTDYVYDALNRVTNRNYSTPTGTPGTGLLANYQATPNVSYFYDNLPNAKGKLIKVSSSVSTTEYTAFDILGRVTAAKQTTDAQYDDNQKYCGCGRAPFLTFSPHSRYSDWNFLPSSKRFSKAVTTSI